MFNRRVSKTDARVEACGAIDELNSALGLARASATDDFVREPLRAVQKNLVGLMGEIATLPEDRERYERDGYQRVAGNALDRLKIKLCDHKEFGFTRALFGRGWRRALPIRLSGLARFRVYRTASCRAPRQTRI